ncbi:DUF1178 family protein [Aurantimonas sp. C2-6-R+9]|uniref:DUF1178 family protein n=1 Tax=unclassified Aurantimonas TaxID=2638230 RepID=UPI002E1744A4|nr:MULTISPECIES: DUF1178 family protein [unclassified Aurantimonas]MEC5291463.1 DUF1178 family protein [Aurantimonas sp. C2-3-R2]MEC5381727.1 DUF1178 family protein [Aurantimonas sp. C2-6-R+9]MEC5412551.1 DUF1178 family protein [Aurantimonas sp. C2-4-R8]
MISFALRCRPAAHAFDGWFRSGEDFERQASAGLLECPICGASDVSKALMKPAVAASPKMKAPGAVAGEPSQPVGEFANAEAAKAIAKLQAMARELRAKSDYVGPKFAEEARRIHYGESEHRQIYGEASAREVEGLSEEGIAAFPLPGLPEDKN